MLFSRSVFKYYDKPFIGFINSSNNSVARNTAHHNEAVPPEGLLEQHPVCLCPWTTADQPGSSEQGSTCCTFELSPRKRGAAAAGQQQCPDFKRPDTRTALLYIPTPAPRLPILLILAYQGSRCAALSSSTGPAISD
eukprot:1157831-Pelagomonas_calceolata.AAC.7